jgi:hypothetical protein
VVRIGVNQEKSPGSGVDREFMGVKIALNFKSNMVRFSGNCASSGV